MTYFTYIDDSSDKDAAVIEINTAIGDALNDTKPIVDGKRMFGIQFHINHSTAQIKLHIKNEWYPFMASSLTYLQNTDATFFHYGKQFGFDFIISDWKITNNSAVINLKLFR